MEFNITVNAPREKVWNNLWNDRTYREWTSAFAEGSRAETDWKKGSKVLFLDGKNSGMVSTIIDNRPNEYMSIKHLGTIMNGVEDMDSKESKQWAGAMENYNLVERGGKTTLHVELIGADIPKEFEDYFLLTWPKALDKLRELSEKNKGYHVLKTTTVCELVIWGTLTYPVQYFIYCTTIQLGLQVWHSNITGSMCDDSFHCPTRGIWFNVSITLQKNACAACCIPGSMATITIIRQYRDNV
jgi:hypothetical protein